MSTANWKRVDPNVSVLIASSVQASSLIEAGVGVGKSSVIAQYAKKLKKKLLILIGSQHPAEDYSGLPYVEEGGKFFRHVPATWARDMCEHPCTLFLDELTSVDGANRAPLLGVCAERKINGLRLHPETLIIAACNPPEFTPNGTPLEMSMNNRFYHHQWVHDKSAWDAGMTASDGEFECGWIPDLPKREEWLPYVSTFGHHIVAYTNQNSGTLDNPPESSSDDRAFPTPRTWKYLRDALALAKCIGAPKRITAELCVGFVGDVAGRAFNEYLNTLDLMPVEQALDDPMLFKHKKDRVDLTIALMTGVCAAVRQQYTPERMTAALELFVDNIAKDSKELAFQHLRHLVEQKRPEGEKLTKDHLALITKLGKSMPAAFKAAKEEVRDA